MSQQNTVVHETKIITADGTAIGVFGLALITFVASTQKLGWTSGTAYLMPWALFLGSIGQLWGSVIDFRKNNYYGAIVLGSFGLFWVAVTAHWMILNGFLGTVPENADTRQFGFACLAYFIFSVFFTIATLEVNKAFVIILVLVNILLLALGLSSIGIMPDVFSKVAAWAELFTGIVGFYASGAIFLNTFYGRVLLPLGAPLGIIRKGA